MEIDWMVGMVELGKVNEDYILLKVKFLVIKGRLLLLKICRFYYLIFFFGIG